MGGQCQPLCAWAETGICCVEWVANANPLCALAEIGICCVELQGDSPAPVYICINQRSKRSGSPAPSLLLLHSGQMQKRIHGAVALLNSGPTPH